MLEELAVAEREITHAALTWNRPDPAAGSGGRPLPAGATWAVPPGIPA